MCIILSSIILNSIPLPVNEVVITALDQKNENAESFEVKITNLEVDGKNFTEFDLNEGKWMRYEDAYYMWRDESDTRQPNGLTTSIKFDIPYGDERNIVFNSDIYSGLVEIDDGTQVQIIDLYNQESISQKVEITPNTNSEMNKLLVKRLVTWFIISFYLFAIIAFLYQTAVKNPKTKNFIILSVIIFTQILIMIYYGGEKSGFHIDEVWTFEISNKGFSYGNDFGIHSDENNYNIWHSSEFFKNILTVTEDQKFNFIEPYTITATDVHPPLYYFIIRFISSLYPNTFSKWIGIVPNIIFFSFSIVVLNKISNIIFKEKILKWLPVILWGYSIWAITTVIYIRMYVLLTLIVLLFVYNYLKYVYDQKITVKSILMMFTVTYLGCMTQYYFLIFAFFFTAYECLKRLFLKDYKNMLLFGSSVLSGVILLFVTFPYTIEHLFLSSRGAQAISNLNALAYIDKRLYNYFDIIEEKLFAGGINHDLLNIFIILGLIYIFNIYVCRIKFNKTKKLGIEFDFLIPLNADLKMPLHIFKSKTAPILMSVISYILMLVWIAPYQEERYIVCISPLICLLFIYYFGKLIEIMKLKQKKNVKYILPGIVIIIIFYSAFNIEPDYLYYIFEDMTHYAEENYDIPLICLEGNDNELIAYMYQFLTIYDQVLFNTYDTNDNINNLLCEDMDKVILHLRSSYIDSNSYLLNEINLIPANSMVDIVKELLGYQDSELLHSSYGHLYRLSNRID